MTLVVRVLPIVVLSTLLTACGFSYAVGPGKDRRTPLEKAVLAGNVTEVKRLLKTGVDPNGTGNFGSSLNAATVREGNLEMIQALLAAGANPNGKGQDGDICWASPLSNAVAAGNLENARALLDAGATIKQTGCSHLVLGWLKPPVMELLVRHGFDLNILDENGRNALDKGNI